MIQISQWGWIRKRWFNTKFTPQILVLHIRVKKWFKWAHILGSNDWYITFGVIFTFKARYLVQTWTWTLWYNQAQRGARRAPISLANFDYLWGLLTFYFKGNWHFVKCNNTSLCEWCWQSPILIVNCNAY